MGRVNGMKEKLHLPLYDAFDVADKVRLEAAMQAQNDNRVIRFFTTIQSKTRLETNLQAPNILPSGNLFEGRALRVVCSPVNKAVDEKDKPVPDYSMERFLSALLFQSVTTLLVGEKVMIEVPTYYFPAGAGVWLPTGQPGGQASNGEPDPMATFRFAEPVMIEAHQNFRVELQFPRSVPDDVRHAYGPFRLWVVLDGYMTRDVQ